MIKFWNFQKAWAAGRNMATFIPERQPTMAIRQTNPPRLASGVPLPEPEVPLPEPEVPENETNTRRSATYVVTAAEMSDGDTDDGEVFNIERVIPDVPAPIGNPRPNADYWDSCGIDSE